MVCIIQVSQQGSRDMFFVQQSRRGKPLAKPFEWESVVVIVVCILGIAVIVSNLIS